MLPVTHTDLLVVVAFTIAITIGLVYQEEAKTRALLREHGYP